MNNWENKKIKISVTHINIRIVPRNVKNFVLVNYILHLQNKDKMQNIYHSFSAYTAHLLIQ